MTFISSREVKNVLHSIKKVLFINNLNILYILKLLFISSDNIHVVSAYHHY